MAAITRREVLKLVPGAAVTALTTNMTLDAQSRFPPALGVQLYTLRDRLPKDPDGVLGTLAAIGYKEVETTADALAAVKPLLAKHGLTAPSGHFNYDDITGAQPSEAFTRSLALARDVGQRYYVIAYIAVEQRKTLDDYRRIADQLNDAARRVKDAGLQFCYHHHSFEFEPLASEGGGKERGWDVLLSRCDKELVGLEVDVFWVATAGLDPVATMADLGSRVTLLHLKDRAKDAQVTFNEGDVPAGAFKEVGSGGLDFPAILKAARTAGVKGFFVEQDHTPDPSASLRQSYQYLSTITI